MEPKRNQPCPCGSGHKYKKCCAGKKEEGKRTMEPKNTFREEVKAQTVSERAMLRRDQKVTYLRFKCQAEMAEADRLHTQRAIGKCKAFGNEIFQLPDSEARTAILAENKAHVEALEKQLAVQSSNRAQQVILSILEEKFSREAKAPRPDYDGLNNSPTLNSEVDDKTANTKSPEAQQDD